jgi:hypothetical protein
METDEKPGRTTAFPNDPTPGLLDGKCDIPGVGSVSVSWVMLPQDISKPRFIGIFPSSTFILHDVTAFPSTLSFDSFFFQLTCVSLTVAVLGARGLVRVIV